MKWKEYMSRVSGKWTWPIYVLASIVVLGIIGYLFILFGGRFVVDEEDLILKETTTIETEDGVVVKTIYDENRSLVSFDNIPEHVSNAFVAIEDSRFYDHAGVDFKSVMRALSRDILSMSKKEGASTITQQLAKNLFLTNDKTWMRKTKEVMAAIYLDRNFTKEKILEYYLNEIYFGHGNYGIQEASRYYFSKDVKDLTVSEGALLAGLVKAPNSYSPIDHPEKALDRRNLVLQEMNQLGMLETEQMIRLQGKTLELNVKQEKTEPWMDSYVDLVLQEATNTFDISFNELKRGGYRIVTNLDLQVQKKAYEQLQKDEEFSGSEAGIEAAFVAMDQASGGIIAAIGGRNYKLGDLNRVLVKRQPGSVMKPLAVYGPAMMLEDYQPYTLIPDEQRTYGEYTAHNYDGQYEGTVSMFEAIQKSKNAPAVWLLNEIGISYAKEYLEKMNLSIPDQGLSIALGGLKEGLTPLQLAESYRAFVHKGETVKGYTIDKIYDRNKEVVAEAGYETAKVFSEQVAWNMTRMLEGVVQNGTGTSGDYTQALAGKTGTTQHPQAKGMVKDAWFVGYTPEIVTAMWVGYDQSDEKHYVTKGSEVPTKLTKDILREVASNRELSSSFTKPDSVEELQEPITLPVIEDLTVDYKLGGFSILQGELTWTPSSDDRVIYHIYKVTEDGDEKIGEVEGQGSYRVKRVNVFGETTYYVQPYNPLINEMGTVSNHVTLSFRN
ncbi:PBP1A family penicillin-binding protein [Radiobacillus kanasensis]|uniref:transglycosylase domain-containing protein n=1 Tax=Radiobacillus kanasensis TaxID=2844358 RepID=UPI001E5789C0|nr:PBP1A family penicillin-binding protein [Radiobacillus kanasensis]UFU00506.1 PBP1A family penicillin-binding protein [Radiobacillus kanasensis]